jgi:hypothetical protein
MSNVEIDDWQIKSIKTMYPCNYPYYSMDNMADLLHMSEAQVISLAKGLGLKRPKRINKWI